MSTATTRTPAQMAADAVAEVFDNIVTTTATLTLGTNFKPDLENAFGEIEDVVYAADSAKFDDVQMAWRLAGREAGYLIGVQVGLRLRGGVR